MRLTTPGCRRWLAVTAAMLATGCGDARCRTSVFNADRSPDRRLDAAVFVRTCGKPMDYTTEVSIVRHGRDPGDRGNVFSADTDLGRSPAGGPGGPRVGVRSDGLNPREESRGQFRAPPSRPRGCR